MRIGIWGDSIGDGAGDTERGGWAFQLKQFVQEYSSDCNTYNLSISGNNSMHLRERFLAEFNSRLPEVVLFAIGVNDSQYLCETGEVKVTLSEMKENLEWLYDSAMESTKTVIFIGITKVDNLKVQPIPWATEKCYLDEKVEQYNNIVQEVAKEKGAHFIPVRNIVDTSNMEDGLHPNTEGHQKMFEVISKYLISQKLLN